LWWSTFIFILIWPPSWNNSISSSAYYSRLNRHSLNDKAWCCKYLRHFSFLNIFLFAAPFLLQLLLADLLTGEGVGVEPNPNVYIKNAPPPKFSLVPTCDGRGGGVVAIKKTWSSIINYCEKIRQKLYTSPRGKQTCMGWYWCCQHS
jgi:hypothetical protein